jgi:hypothetical protein
MDWVVPAFFVLIGIGLVVVLWSLRDRRVRTPEDVAERAALAEELDRRKTETLERQDRFNIRR